MKTQFSRYQADNDEKLRFVSVAITATVSAIVWTSTFY